MNRTIGPVRLTESDYIAESIAVAHQLYGRKVKWNYIIAVLAAGLGLVLWSYASSRLIQTLGGIYLAMAVVLLGISVYWPYSVRSQAIKIARNPLNRSFFDEVTYEFREDGYETRATRGIVSSLPYSCVVKARLTANNLILHTSQLHFFYIPVNVIDEELLAFLREKLRMSGIEI